MTEVAVASPKPSEFGTVGDYWANEGWLVSVYFNPTPRTLRPKQHIEAIGPLLPSRHSPLQRNGNGNQGCYLAGISETLAHLLLALLNVEVLPYFATAAHVNDAGIDHDALDDIHQIKTNLPIPETQRLQLGKARIGQGLFRKRVLLVDPSCRVTGVDDPRLLIASHIKPWKDASNTERINGFNGLMLSPRVDALFDEHLISFENEGKILVHKSLPKIVLDRWSLDLTKAVDRFKPEQTSFLDHHRKLFEARPG